MVDVHGIDFREKVIYHENLQMDCITDTEPKSVTDPIVHHKFEYVELLQFTGLKDKNGKEIYEGDIVSGYIPDSERDIEFDIGIVKFEEGSFDIHRDKYLGGIASCSLNKSIKIIGNIYENPELLK